MVPLLYQARLQSAKSTPSIYKDDVLRTIKHNVKVPSTDTQQHRRSLDLPMVAIPPEAGDELEYDRRHDGALSEDEAGDIVSVVSPGTTFSQRDQVFDEDNNSDAESDYLRRRTSYQQRSGGLVQRSPSPPHNVRNPSWPNSSTYSQSSPRIIRTRRPNTAAPQP